MTIKTLFAPLIFVLLALLLSGCLEEPRDPLAERIGGLKDELAAVAGDFPDGPLTLEKAIAHAHLNNLSIRAAELEYAIAQEVTGHQTLKMLPSLQANLELSQRDKYNASSSRSLSSGKQSLESSYSAEKFARPSNLTLIWSLMDLGLGVLRERQAGERERISLQSLRRLRQQIAMDTAIAFCRLRAAEEIAECAASLEDAVNLQLRFNSQSGEEGTLAKTEEARRAAPLLGGLRTLGDLRKELQAARAALAKAMGVTRPGELTLDKSVDWSELLPSVPSDPETLYETALANRPEMYTADSEAAISRDDAKAALLQMAPNVNFRAALYNNPDQYLAFHNWMEAAVQVSWDLFRFPLRRKEAKTAAQRAELSVLKRRMTAASILVQVNLALVEAEAAREKLALGVRIEGNRRVILRGAEDSAGAGKGNKSDVLGERLRHVSDFASMAWALSDCMAARARLLSALGVDYGESGWKSNIQSIVQYNIQ